MRYFALFLMLFSLCVFSVGCNEPTTSDPVVPAEEGDADVEVDGDANIEVEGDADVDETPADPMTPEEPVVE